MQNLTNTGRIFYGIFIAVIGLFTIYYHDFHPYLLPPNHSWIPGLAVFAIVFGAMLVLAARCIVFEKKIRPVSLLLGTVLLLIVCFYYIPYEFIATSNYMHFGEWENVAKLLGLSSGAFIIAGCFPAENENPFFTFLSKLIPYGVIVFALTIISYGINHFLYAKDVADYAPSWLPVRIFWTYLAGIGLLGSGIAIILKIKPALFAVMLGAMIFTWVILLHIPRVVLAHSLDDRWEEVISTTLALAYSGIALVIAGSAKKTA